MTTSSSIEYNMKYVNVKNTKSAEKSGHKKNRVNTKWRTLFSTGILLTLTFIFVTKHGDKLKDIFDPEDIFNPHKKTDANWEFSMSHLRQHF